MFPHQINMNNAMVSYEVNYTGFFLNLFETERWYLW
jgi:hypothetical protein